MAVAWLFPGQGTQFVGMGKELYDQSPAAKAVFDRADSALGFSISALCFEGPQAELVRTEHTQPAIVTTSIAALEALRERVPELPTPEFAAGHSLGEYSALVAASALAFEDAVRLVHLRGKAMQEAVPEGQGAMAAILGGSEAAVFELCEAAGSAGPVSPANFNSPGQIVIAGSAEAVRYASELAPARKLKAIPLQVSAPFHCALMEPAARAVELALEHISLGPFRFPVVSNVDAAPNQDPDRARELLVRQIDGPVLWEQSVRKLAELGVDRALEIGPGRVLSGMVRKIDKSIQVSGVSDAKSLMETVAQLSA